MASIHPKMVEFEPQSGWYKQVTTNAKKTDDKARQ